MRRSSVVLCSCLAMLALSACDRTADNDIAPPVTAETGPSNEPGTPDTPAPGDDTASMRYSCGGGYSVAIMGDTARVTTQDGRTIDLPRVADRSPPLFAGEALEFSVDGDGAVLGQDEGGPFPCEEAD